MSEEDTPPPPNEKFCINGKPVREMPILEIEHHLTGVTQRLTNASQLATVAINDMRKLAGMHAILEYERERQTKSAGLITDSDMIRKLLSA
jgi:hypothetical protein